jgi:Uma2 family endonuclease
VREYWLVDPEARTLEVLALDRDAFHTVQVAAGDDEAISPLLGDVRFPLPVIFAGVGADEA